MDYWPSLSPIGQLPFAYRVWAWWVGHGPKRRHGTFGASAAFRLLTSAARHLSSRDHAYFTLTADGLPALTIDLRDFESFHHAIPVWYRGDAELEIIKAVLGDEDVYVDVGANYGAYALRVAHASKTRVVAVEPQSAVAEALRRSVSANAFGRFEVVEAALGGTVGQALLAVGSASGSASLRHDRLSAAAGRISVQLTTLDELCRRLRIDKVRCIKLDVEGAEADVLRGATQVLARDRPIVLFEAGCFDPQQDAFSLLRSLGYSEFWDQSTFQASFPVQPRLDQQLTNIIALPAGEVDHLRQLLTRGAQ